MFGESVQPCPPVGDGGFEFADAGADSAAEFGCRVVGFEVDQLPVHAPFEVGEFVAQRRDPFRGRGGAFGCDGGVEAAGPVVEPVGSEHSDAEVAEQRGVEPVLVEVHRLGVLSGDVRAALVRRLAGVVVVGASMVAPHPQAADAAAQQAPVQVDGVPAATVRAGSGRGLAGATVRDRAIRHGGELFAADDGRVGGLVGPDPHVRRVDPVAALLAGAPVPDLIAGVLRVTQHFPDAAA
ncbi:MAG TPA: hypothetical protein VHD58_06230 [Mycobacteriales bacterium]|nr:hypothetical protein [Mycobacteriales bacterium]